MSDYQKGAPGPDQLPQGAATQLNEAQASGDQAAAAAAAPPIKMQAPRPQDHGPVALGPDDSALFGPDPNGGSPTEGVGTVVNSKPPANIGATLPALQHAAAQPDAPPALRGLLSIILHQLGTQ